jgi:hypothetical protein
MLGDDTRPRDHALVREHEQREAPPDRGDERERDPQDERERDDGDPDLVLNVAAGLHPHDPRHDRDEDRP